MNKSTINRINGIAITIICIATILASISLVLNEKINVVVFIAAIMLMMGVIFIDVSLVNYYTRRKFCTMEVTATCVQIQQRYDHEMRQDLYRPVWEYYMDGEMRRVTSDVWVSRGMPEEGERATLMIDPENKDQFYQGKRFGTFNLVFLLVGLAFLMTGIGLLGAGILLGNIL